MYHLNLSDDEFVKQIVTAGFPEYRGHKVAVRWGIKSMSLESYWAGGSRSFYAIVRVVDGQAMSVPGSHPMFAPMAGIDGFAIPDGFVIVEHCIFCGKDTGIVVHTSQSAPLLPAAGQSLTDDEIMVLLATAAWKSSYAGVSDYRAHALQERHGLSRQRVETARVSLQAKKLLDARRAITNAGRNAIENHPKRNTI